MDVRHYRVFCASPGDVTGDRKLLQAAIDDLNETVYRNKPYRLEFVGWELDVVSDYGSDPQKFINDQIGDSFDIFVMILWKKIGSKTPRADSGTIEELTSAITRWEASGFPKIGIYLRDEAINLWDEPINQLQGVKALVEGLRSKSFLVRYKPKEFPTKIRQFLIANMDILTAPRTA